MIHLLFLAVSLGLVLVGQKLLLLVLERVQNWSVRRSLQLLALVMPISALALFALTMLPLLFTPGMEHETDPAAHQEWLVAVIGFIVFSLPVGLALLLNLVRLAWLYLRTMRRTWEGPAGLRELVVPVRPVEATGSSSLKIRTRTTEKAGTTTTGGREVEARSPKLKVQIRLWFSSRSFAYNLPGLWPGASSIVVVSTAMVENLSQTELQAVLWHETAHLSRHDFWVIWFATWWRDSFFYLPLGWRFLHLIQAEQELACDERVVRQGGLPMTLALADALLKVWEEAVTRGSSSSNQPNQKPLAKVLVEGLEPPGLASSQPAGGSADLLTEQRVNRLIELGSNSADGPLPVESLSSRLKAGGMLSGGVGLWLLGLELTHLIMLPLGCAISLGML